MRDILQKIYSYLFMKIDPQRKKGARKPKAQSMVEFAILLPVLIMLFSGMVEFGFMLNSYLSLLDATRQAARLYSNTTPFYLDTATNTIEDDLNFYLDCAQSAVDILAPPSDPDARQIILDPTRDDVVISVLSISIDEAPDPDIISTIVRHPTGSLYYSLYGNQLSAYTDTDIENFMTQNDRIPVETGILIVEIYHGYKGVLKLPWVEPFMNDDNPVTLHASTIMPLVAAKP
ncbi:MAG: pilus assembly protein [Chloroflexi bacterium]|nr:pilus assembly protein [Chloroflexota bacterium]